MSIRAILVVELLGGFGDVLLILPAVHALARSHPKAQITVLTFVPGDALLRADPLVHHVVATDDHTEGAPRRVVADELGRRSYDLVVSTTTYDGIDAVCAAGAPHAVTNLWRSPPADERIDRRFLALLAADGLIEPGYADVALELYLHDSERRAGRAELTRLLPGSGSAPLVLVPGSGMRIKQWPAHRWAELTSRSPRPGPAGTQRRAGGRTTGGRRNAATAGGPARAGRTAGGGR